MKSVDGAEKETLTCLRGSDIYTFDENYTIFSDGELWFKVGTSYLLVNEVVLNRVKRR